MASYSVKKEQKEDNLAPARKGILGRTISKRMPTMDEILNGRKKKRSLKITKKK